MKRTIEEILEMFPDTTAKDWGQHPNGGGWVKKTVNIDASAYIGEAAIVSGNASIEDNARSLTPATG